MERRLPAILTGGIILACSSLIATPLMRHDGLARGMDVVLHVGNVAECAYFLREGKLPPFDWVPDIAGGRGGPNYLYYGTLGFLMPACLVNLGLSPEEAIRASTAAVLVLGFISAALFASTAGGWLSGLCAGALFTFGPYHFTLVYGRRGYPEHLAYSLYPLAFYFATRTMGRKSVLDLICCSVVVFLIVAAHTLSLIILLPFLAVYFLVRGKIMSGRTGIPRCMAMLALAALLLAPCLIGPIFGRGDVVLNEQLGSTGAAHSYASFGIPWYSMLHREFLSDIVSRCVPGRVHLLALLAAIIIAAAMTDVSTRRTAFLHLSLAVGALLLVERSVAGLSVQVVPWLTYLQFPWRFLALFNLFAAVSFASCVSKTSLLPDRWRYLLAAAVPLLSVAVYLKHLPPQEATRFPTRDGEGIRSSMTTLDHENKYLPVGAKVFDQPAPKLLLEVPDGECYETGVQPNDYGFRVNARSAQTATFHQYFFKGWRAEVDGFPTSLQRDQSGLCRVEIPAGVHEVRLWFVRAPLHAAALVVSAVAWMAVVVTVAVVAVRSVYRARRGERGSGPCRRIESGPLPPAP